MNAWSDPDTIAPQAAIDMAMLLEARAQSVDQQRAYAAVVAALNPQPGEHVLDLGCGTGVLAHRIAQQIGWNGAVLGLDVSVAMLDIARQRSDHPSLRFEHGNALAVDAAAEHFDAALAARLLMHVPDPVAVLREARRVVRPGGRLVLLERDWGTFTLDHSDRALTRRIIDWRCDTIDGDNWMGRKLPRLCTESGWHVRDVQPLVSIARDEHATLLGSLRHAAQLAAQHSIISPPEHTAWIAEIEQRLEKGVFFATLNEYIVIADRPYD